MTAYIAEIPSRVAGIPCLIGVIDFNRVPGTYSYNAASDMDYNGWTEFTFDVLDRRGRVAGWLEKKLTFADTERFEEEAAAYFEAQNHDL